MSSAVAEQQSLFPGGSTQQRSRVAIGKEFELSAEGNLSVVFRLGAPLYHFRNDDTPARYLAAVDLVRHHGVKVTHVGIALGIDRRVIHRMIRRFEARGIEGLFPGKGRRMPTKIRDAVEQRLKEMVAQGVSLNEAARRLGVTAPGVRKALVRLGLLPASKAQNQQCLPECGSAPLSEDAEPEPGPTPSPITESAGASQATDLTIAALTVPMTGASHPTSTDADPLNRSGDRLMAQLGLLDDAAPLFAPGVVPRGGVLLALPSLIASGIFDIAPKVYGSIGPAFYGLRTSVLAFMLLALLRIKRAENLKEVAPRDLGRILGLDRAPEMKTLRRKLHELAARESGLEFMRLLAQKRVSEYSSDMGYLYVDGHVRVYSGDVTLPKAYVMQRRLAMPGTTDYWVNDAKGQPLLVITAEANEGMTKMLPPVLKEVRAVIGDRRATIVFDRGGWSPKLFKSLIADNWDILTYRKGKTRRLAHRGFREHKATIDGREVSYQLAEKRVRLLGGKLKLRQITMLGEDGYQTNILTSKEGALPAEVAYYMFNRWRQENYFKYMEAEFALDALAEYGTEEADPNRMVPNPKRKAIDKELNAARLAVAELERKLGAAAFDNKEDQRRTVRGFKIANGGAIGKPLRDALEKVQSIKERRLSIPTRVPVSEAIADEPVRLRTETKRLSDTFKMVAYQAETALVELLRPHYPRTQDEGRTLIASALQSAADLKVNDGELRVTLAAQSSKHRTRGIAAVCRQLNKTDFYFPGTNLRLVYDIDGSEVSP